MEFVAGLTIGIVVGVIIAMLLFGFGASTAKAIPAKLPDGKIEYAIRLNAEQAQKELALLEERGARVLGYFQKINEEAIKYQNGITVRNGVAG